MSCSLNADQKEAADQIFHFLSSDDKEFSLTGPAGTGKTYLMKYIMTDLLADYEKTCKLLGIEPKIFTIALTATTHKAAEVLSNALSYPTKTIHSYLHLKLQNDYQTGQSTIMPKSSF